MDTERPGSNPPPVPAWSGAAWIALACGLVPLVAVHACYLIAAAEGRVPWCFPYLEGCTSISRAARLGPANLLFKALMLPAAALTALFWMQAARGLHRAASRRPRRVDAMRVLGIVGALFLALYVCFLGVDGEMYRWMRRYGVTVYFSFTVLAQMLLASLLPPGWLRAALLGLCATMLLLGLASLPLQHLLPDRDAALNAIEWSYALLMSVGFTLVGLAWWRSANR